MAGDQRSLQDLIQARQHDGLVDREEQSVRYQYNRTLPVADERRRFLFNIHGDAGVGKTFLVKQLRKNASDSGALTAYTDESAGNVLCVMTAIAEEFARAGHPLSEFEQRAEAYRQRSRELEPEGPDGLTVFITKAAVVVTLAPAHDVPIAGDLRAALNAAAAGQPGRPRNYLLRALSHNRDERSLQSPADELTPAFVAELNRVGANRNLALFFDDYERTAPSLDVWLRDLYSGKYGNLPGTLITTISGRLPLNCNRWGDYLPVLADVPLSSFSETQARQLLASKGIVDASSIDALLGLSGRLPIWLATLADVCPGHAAEIGDKADDAVAAFLSWESDPARRAIAVTAALPRTFNQDVLAAITDPDQVHELFSWLSGRSFVVQQVDSWHYHEVVRSAMARFHRTHSPVEWRADHLALAGAHNRRAGEIAGEDAAGWENQDWVDHVREEMYHLLCADLADNLPLALASAVKAAETSDERARQWARLLADAARDSDQPTLRRWAQCLGDGIQDGGLADYLTYLIDDAELAKGTLAAALHRRADSYRLAGRYAEALADYSQSIELDPERAGAMAGRSLTYRMLGRYEEALADYGRSIELDPEGAGAMAGRGLTNLMLGHFHEALADFGRAIELHPRDASTIARRGQSYLMLGRYEEALADYGHAVELSPGDASILAGRGDAYQMLGRAPEALADYEQAVDLGPGKARVIAGRGQAYLMLERYAEALADFGRAIELDPGDAAVLAGRGESYRMLERYGEALADYDRAIELDPDFAWAIAGRGDTHRMLGRNGEALADYDRVIELDPGDVSVLARRAESYRILGRHEEALADFGRAVELDPGYAWAIARRGLTYRMLGRYEEALADLGRAVELDPQLAWAITRRAETYLMLERYAVALADYGRAIELDPELAWVFAGRGEAYRLLERCEEALADFSRAIELDPGDASVIAGRAGTFRMLERYDEALADFSGAIELDPGDASVIAGRAGTFQCWSATTRRWPTTAARPRWTRVMPPLSPAAPRPSGYWSCATRRWMTSAGPSSWIPAMRGPLPGAG